MADFEINKRLKGLIEEVYKMTPYAFSRKYNDNGGVKTSRIITCRNGISSKMVDTILEAYPEINKSWLLTGEGNMLKKNVEEREKNQGDVKTNSIEAGDSIMMSRDVYEPLRADKDTIKMQQQTMQLQQETIQLQQETIAQLNIRLQRGDVPEVAKVVTAG